MYCDFGDRNIEDVEILPPDQVQQHVERALEGLEKYLESLRRDVQIPRHLRDRLTLHHGERHLGLRRRRYRRRGGRRGIRHKREFRSHR